MKKTDIKSVRSPSNYSCRVRSVTRLSGDSFLIELEALNGAICKYHAGQYLELHLDLESNGQFQRFSYSIANRFDSSNSGLLKLILHDRSVLSAQIHGVLRDCFKNDEAIKVSLPLGEAFLQTDLSVRHVLVAAGSGIAKIKCIAEEMISRRPDTKVSIYWSNKRAQDFYLLDGFEGWEQQHPKLKFTPILESPNKSWTGRSGYIYQVIKEDYSDLSQIQMYLCGSPLMVYGTIDQLKTLGLSEANCYSDVFEYAPRERSS